MYVSEEFDENIEFSRSREVNTKVNTKERSERQWILM